MLGLEMIWHWTTTTDEWTEVLLYDNSDPPVPIGETEIELELYAFDIVPGATSSTILGLASAEPGLILRSTDDGDTWYVVFDVTSACPEGPCTNGQHEFQLSPCACQALCGEDPSHAEMWDIEISRHATSNLALCVGGVGDTDCGIVVSSTDDGLTWVIERHECAAGVTNCTGTDYNPPENNTGTWRHKKFLEIYNVSIFHGDNSAIVAGYGGQIAVRDPSTGIWADRSQYGNSLLTPAAVTLPMYGSATNSGTASTGKALITGEGGYLRFSGDGGQGWATDAPTGEPWRVRDVHFISDTEGWWVGQAGVIKYSDTAGEFWSPEDSDAAFALSFLNAVVLDGSDQVGVAVGEVYSDMGGDHTNIRFNLDCQSSDIWEPATSFDYAVTDELGDLLEVTWAGGVEFWAVGEKGRIYHSDSVNGPEEWTQFVPKEETYTQFKDFRIEGVDFSSTTEGLFVGERNRTSVLTGVAYQYSYDAVHESVDFTEIDIDESNVAILTDVTIVGNMAYAVGVKDTGSVKQGIVLSSTRSGGVFGSFELLEAFDACTVGDALGAIATPILSEVEVAPGGAIWIAGECGRVWFSSNGGADWSPIKSQTSAHIRGMSFPTANAGFLACHRSGRTGSCIVMVETP